MISLLFRVLEASLNRRNREGQESVFYSLPCPFGGQSIILRTFMMRDGDAICTSTGMHYVSINALLSKNCWYPLSHSFSKFGSFYLGDLANTENLSCPPHRLSKSPPGGSLRWSCYRLLADMGISPTPFHILILSVSPP